MNKYPESKWQQDTALSRSNLFRKINLRKVCHYAKQLYLGDCNESIKAKTGKHKYSRVFRFSPDLLGSQTSPSAHLEREYILYVITVTKKKKKMQKTSILTASQWMRTCSFLTVWEIIIFNLNDWKKIASHVNTSNWYFILILFPLFYTYKWNRPKITAIFLCIKLSALDTNLDTFVLWRGGK